jgi:hypothetical protein
VWTNLIKIFKQKNDLTKRYHQILTEIEDNRNFLEEIGNDEKWLEWLDNFSKQITTFRDIPDTMKKKLLKIIIHNIIVAYDHSEKVHRLTINFKLPVILNNSDNISSTSVLVNPPKVGRKSIDQNIPVDDYSTVTDFARFLG